MPDTKTEIKQEELEVILNYKDIAEMFEKAEQYCLMCQYMIKKIKTRLDEAGVESNIEEKENANKFS